MFDGQLGVRVRSSREEILVDFRPSDAAWANALDFSGFAFAQVAVSFFPAQGLLVGLAVTGLAYVMSSSGGVVAGLALTVVLMLVERQLRRVGLTRFRGHLMKGGYDAKYGQANRCEADAPAVS